MNTTPSPAIEAVELPPLPISAGAIHPQHDIEQDGYTAEQMRTYALSVSAAKQEELDKMREGLTPFANIAYFHNIVDGMVETLDDLDQQRALLTAFANARAALANKG